jgi:hypothetical protein
MFCHNFLIVRTYGRTDGHTCAYVPAPYVRTFNVMSQRSDWKRAHMCTENHVCFGRVHGSQLREGANAGQHTPTLSLPPSHYCLDGEVYRGNRHYNLRACVPWYGHTAIIWYVYVYCVRTSVQKCYVTTYVRTRYVRTPCTYAIRTMVVYV